MAAQVVVLSSQKLSASQIPVSLLSGEIDTLLDGKVPQVQKQIAQETVVILGTQVLNAERNAGAGSGGTIPKDYLTIPSE